jgi:hypothetical protein
MSTRAMVAVSALLTACQGGSAGAGIEYAIDDGAAERAIGIDSGEDMIWFNVFPVQPGGEVIESISAAFGRPGLSPPWSSATAPA